MSHGVDPLFSHFINVPYGGNYARERRHPPAGADRQPDHRAVGTRRGDQLPHQLGVLRLSGGRLLLRPALDELAPGRLSGGLLFGFSPYVVAEGIAHVHTMFVCLIPFIFIVLDEIFIRQRYSQRVLGALLGLLIIA